MGIEGAFARFFEDFDELLAIKAAIAPFNIFVALGMERAEIRHSHFLAYISDPNRPHGIGAEFLKRFLYRALKQTQSADPAPSEVMSADFDQVSVERERANIDVLIQIPSAKTVVAIENKIGARETGDQLVTYHTWVEAEFPADWRKVYLFLTPTGTEPSHARWQPISYQVVVETLKWLRKPDAFVIRPDVDLALNHYTEMLERYVLKDKNREIALDLYNKHKEVFDFIAEAVAKKSDSIIDKCVEAITIRADVDKITKSKFRSKAWTSDEFLMGHGSVNQGLYFEIRGSSEIRIFLYLGPNWISDREKLFREKLYDAAIKASPPFSPQPKLNRWTYLLDERLLSSEEAKQSTDACVSLASGRLNDLLEKKLPEIDRIVASALTG